MATQYPPGRSLPRRPRLHGRRRGPCASAHKGTRTEYKHPEAYNLSWKLADGSKLLDSYETERRAGAARVLEISTKLMQRYQECRQDAHERGNNTRPIDVSYWTSDGPPVPGDRAPDAPLVHGHGRKIRLFDLSRGPHPTHLIFGAPSPTAPHTYAVLRPGQPLDRRADGFDLEGYAFTAYHA